MRALGAMRTETAMHARAEREPPKEEVAEAGPAAWLRCFHRLWLFSGSCTSNAVGGLTQVRTAADGSYECFKLPTL